MICGGRSVIRCGFRVLWVLVFCIGSFSLVHFTALICYQNSKCGRCDELAFRVHHNNGLMTLWFHLVMRDT